MAKWFKVLGIIILVLASILGGALLGTIIGAIYAPAKVIALLTGEGDSNAVTDYMDDKI